MKAVLYNSLSRKKEELAPLHPPELGLYTCGPTVYNHQHVGNYRTYIFEDILRRVLELSGLKVKHVRNVTDVGHLTSQADEGEDKMEVGAAREGKTAWEVAKFYTEAFNADCRDLRLLAPHVDCNATDHIPEQIALIRRLEERGFIYKTSDGLYFDTKRFPDYGRLIGRSHLEGLSEGARIQANPEKRAPTDFAVWKFSPAGSRRHMEWDTPWGRGFPGWHIECSAMAMKYLGETFDIHCGGVDHIPIHHTNEIAQAEGATGKPFVRIWMHGEFLLMNAAKMAKSQGGFITLAHLKDKGFDPLDFRYHCLTAHYRKQLDFTWESLESARTARRRLRDLARSLPAAAGEGCPHQEAFRTAVDDDLNAPAALAAAWDCAKGRERPAQRRATLEAAEGVFALGLFEAEGRDLTAEESSLLEERVKARASKDFARADELRARLDALGIVVEDTPKGQKWRRK